MSDNSTHRSSGANCLCVGIFLLSTIHAAVCLPMLEPVLQRICSAGSLRCTNVCLVAMTKLLTFLLSPVVSLTAEPVCAESVYTVS